jgi:glutamine synthetase
MDESTRHLIERVEQDQLRFLWVSYHDYGGRASSKTIPPASMKSAIGSGVVFAKANLNMDAHDHQVAGATLLADSGDMLAVPDPRSYTRLPRYDGTALTHAWLREPDGSPWAGCPRTQLDSVVARLAAKGYSVQAALEPEFTLFTRGADGSLSPINQSKMFSQDGLARANDFIVDLLDELAGMGIDVPQLGKEYGPGQYELSLHHGSPMWAVDSYLIFRATLHAIAEKYGMVATLMPKPFADFAGNSLHVHMSIWNEDESVDLTPNSADQSTLSNEGRWFMGGLLAHSAPLTAIGSPTVNSYKRLLPGSWAPANAYWGYGNRSGVLRVPGVGSRRHLEYRSPDNTAQPYLLMSALLAAGLDGLERKMEPGPPFEGDVGHISADEIERHRLTFLPRTLPDALAALEQDDVIKDAIGPEILKHFLAVKRSELAEYNLVVHQWERDTYLELQ